MRRAYVLSDSTDCARLIHGEGDGLPGVVVDKYGELVIVQLLVKGLDSAAVRKEIVATLRERIKPAAILERPDPRIRELEGLSAPSLEPLYAADGTNPLTATQFKLNGLTFQYDANSGQKTGAFLDQHANYKAAEQWASILSPGGRAVDVCTYQGGFALHLARVSNRVTGIDASHASLEVAERNLAANRDKAGDHGQRGNEDQGGVRGVEAVAQDGEMYGAAVQDPGDPGDEPGDAEHDEPGQVDIQAQRPHRQR